jgi:hypothetical protein
MSMIFLGLNFNSMKITHREFHVNDFLGPEFLFILYHYHRGTPALSCNQSSLTHTADSGR